jgi:hypothetical protein
MATSALVPWLSLLVARPPGMMPTASRRASI